jgi:hypothetical protein
MDFEGAVKYSYNRLPKASYNLPAYQIGSSDTFFQTEKKKFLTAFPKIKTKLYADIDKNNDAVTVYIQNLYSEKYIHEVR